MDGRIACAELSRRIDADLALYQGGRLAGTSTQVLEDLGVMPQLMDPIAFAALALGGELEMTRDGSIPRLSERVGYRVVQPGFPATLGVLATPQLADDASLAVRRLDLALVLLLATLAGVAPRSPARGRASRALSRPVAELRRSGASRSGKGDPMPSTPHSPPLEFEPVFGAFGRMAADIRSSQSALEEARKRTAAVLATVATGVVGLDPQGRVLIANPQAVDILRRQPARRASRSSSGLGPEWAPLAAVVHRFLRDPEADSTAELEVGGRRLTLQLAPLGPDVRGVVIALNDVTDALAGGAGAGLGRDGAAGGARDQEPAHARCAWACSTCGGSTGTGGAISTGRWRRPPTGCWRRSTGSTPSRAPSAGSPRRRATSSRSTGSTSPSPSARWSSSTGWRRRAARCGWRAHPLAFGAARADEVKEVVVNLLENARNAGATAGAGARSGRDGSGCRTTAAGIPAGAAAADLRAPVLDHDQRVGPRARDREAAGGELERAGSRWRARWGGGRRSACTCPAC